MLVSTALFSCLLAATTSLAAQSVAPAPVGSSRPTPATAVADPLAGAADGGVLDAPGAERDAGEPDPSVDGAAGANVDAGPSSDLPGALPSLDDDVLAHFDGAADLPAPALPFGAWVAGRVRGALDESRDRAPADDLQAGVALTGRLGARAAVGPHEARVAIGEGGRIGEDRGTLVDALVPRPALPVLYEAAFVARTAAIGFDMDVTVGRFPWMLADGRWVGDEPFDPRGRTLDGIAFASTAAPLRVTGGAFFLGPLDRFDPQATSFFAALGAGYAGEGAALDGYGIAHRDGGAPERGVFGATATTIGGRASATLFDVTGALGLDGQLAWGDGAAAAGGTLPGVSGHADVALRYAPRVVLFEQAGAPFVEVSGDATGGQITAGRSFRAPAPTQHGRLGLLDALAFDDVWSTALGVGVQTERGLLLGVAGRASGVIDQNGVVRDPLGRVITKASRTERLLLSEVDVELIIPIAAGARVELGYAIGLGGPALPAGTATQRLYGGVAFTIDAAGHSDGLPRL